MRLLIICSLLLLRAAGALGQQPDIDPRVARIIDQISEQQLQSKLATLSSFQTRHTLSSPDPAFNQRGFAAVRLTEANENYAKQHSGNDTLDGVSFPYLAQNARVNAAGLATLALAPPAPSTRNERGAPTLSRDPSGYDAKLTWRASPGAAGYRIYWRPTWAPDWEHMLAVGNVTEYVLRNISIDDHVFGVAALGADGSESLVSAYVNPSRQDILIKTVPVTKLRLKPPSDEPASQDGEPSLLGGRFAAAAKTASKAEGIQTCFIREDIGFRRCLAGHFRSEGGSDGSDYVVMDPDSALGGDCVRGELHHPHGAALPPQRLPQVAV